MTTLPKLFYSKIFLLLLIIALGFTGTIEYNKWQERKAVDQEIAALKEEERQLKEQNKNLEQSIQFLSSEEYQEKLARLQLNLKKEGEIVVNFPAESEAEQIIETPNQPNAIKWWEYIFLN